MNKLRIGIIGTGRHSVYHMQGHMQNQDLVEVVAVCDVIKELAEERAKTWGVKTVYTDYTKLVQDPNIDAVDICTRSKDHMLPTIAAAEAGKHIMVEKVMAITVKECDAMVRAARKAGVKLMPVHNIIFFPPVTKLKEIMDAGGLGEVLDIACTATSRGDWSKRMTPGEPYGRGGGLLLHYGYHMLYPARWLMGEIEKVTAIADMRRNYPPKYGLVDDVAVATWKYKGAEKYGLLHLEGFSPIHRNLRIEVTGTEAVGLVSGRMEQCIKVGGVRRLSPLVIYSPEGAQFYYDGGPHIYGGPGYFENPAADIKGTETMRRMQRHWAECILKDREPIQTGEDGKRVIEIVRAMYESSETGKTITLP